jgi:iron complex outermembrane recepter protein
MRINQRFPWWFQGATVVMSLCGPAAHAESPAAEPAAAAADAGERHAELLEEIIVTADKKNSFGANYVQAGTFRNGLLMNTPLTVNILTRELLDSQQASSIGDALKNSAGVTYSQTNPAVTSNVSIRGIPVDNRANFRLNGGLPIINLIDLPLEDKDRVEVLKGVSSLYYGFTTPSGIVNLVMKRPTTEALTSFSATANEYGGATGAADVSRKFWDDKIGVRVNGAGGEIKTGVHGVIGHRALATIALDFNPIDSITLRLDGEYVKKSQVETPIILLPLTKGVLAPGTVLPPLADPRQNLGAPWLTYDAHEQNTMGHLEWRFSENWSITAEAGRSYLRRDRNLATFQNYNLTTGAGQLAVREAPDTTYNNDNYRVELAGAVETGPVVQQVSLGSSYNLRTTNVGRTTTVNFPQNYYSPVAIAPGTEPAPLWTSTAPIHDKGAYLFDKVSYTTWVDLLLGVRYTKYESNTTVLATNASTIYSARNTSKSVGLVVKPYADVLSLYATYLEGLEEGGLAPLTTVNNGQLLPPGISKQKEVGVKFKPIEPMLLTLAYFDVNRPSAFTNTQNVFVQDGETSYTGVEFSATGELGNQWSILLNAMTEDAKLEKSANPALIGARPENTPKFTAASFVEYRPSFGGLGDNLGLTAGFTYVGNRPVDMVSGANTLYIPGYTTFDAGARYSWHIARSAMSVRLKVENLTNKRYWAGTGSDFLSEGLPRNVKVQFEAQL